MLKPVLLDSNLIIYRANGAWQLQGKYDNLLLGASAISKLETLGFPNISAAEEQRVSEYVSLLYIYPIDETVLARAIRLRQRRSMSVGDAIVAATALVHGCELWTHNTKDFSHIGDLTLFDPILS